MSTLEEERRTGSAIARPGTFRALVEPKCRVRKISFALSKSAASRADEEASSQRPTQAFDEV
jgi:hypothetical protein